VSDRVPAPDTPDALLADVREEGVRVVRAAAAIGLPLRLVGGVAFWARCPSAELPALRRSYGDIDVVGLSRSRRDITDFLEGQGYVADELFNALHGAQRLYFTDPVNQRPLDVILDRFAMCHGLDLRDRLDVDPLSIPLAELLLTKLQVVELNDKDVRDLVALLADHDVAGPPPDAVDVARVTKILGADWGFEHTVRRNLERLTSSLGDYAVGDDVRRRVAERIDAITAALDAGRKTAAWKARSLVGERVRWYEQPEEIPH
jgi:hypothetical protein